MSAHDAPGSSEGATTTDATGDDSGSSDAVAGDTFLSNPRPLCPNGRVPVGMPLPSGVTLLHDYSSLSSALTAPLLANDTAVFLGSAESIHRLNLADNSDTTLVTALSYSSFTGGVQGIAIDGPNLYFTESGSPSHGVATVPLDGSAGPTTLLAASNLGPISVSNGYVYFELNSPSGNANPSIVRISTSGGATTTLINLPGFLNSLLAAGGYVYFTYSTGSNVLLLRVPVTAQAPASDGGAPGDGGGAADANSSSDAAGSQTGDAGGNGNIVPGAEFVATATGIWALVSDGTHLIWGDGDRLMTMPLSGGTPAQIGSAPAQTGFLTTSSSIQFIAATSGFVYWSYRPSCSDVLKTSIDGTAQTTLVPSADVYALAVNSTKAFFVAGNGQLLSVAR